MSKEVIEQIFRQVEKEPYAGKLGLRLLELEPGRAVVEMAPRDDVGNILGMIHGGAIFSLIDEAFQVSCNAYGTVAVALSMTLTYHSPPRSDATLRAESTEIHKGWKTGTYAIRVTDDRGNLIASCQALAYRKEQPLPFLSDGGGTDSLVRLLEERMAEMSGYLAWLNTVLQKNGAARNAERVERHSERFDDICSRLDAVAQALQGAHTGAAASGSRQAPARLADDLTANLLSAERLVLEVTDGGEVFTEERDRRLTELFEALENALEQGERLLDVKAALQPAGAVPRTPSRPGSNGTG